MSDLSEEVLPIYKEQLLNKVIPSEYSAMHKKRTFWIHDLEYYELAYNCIGLEASQLLDNSINYSFDRALREIFRGIIRLTNFQSGGIGFINFDMDLSKYIENETDEQLVYFLNNFLIDLNCEVRKGCELAYVTLNIGLDTTANGKRVSLCLLEAYKQGDLYNQPFVFPNIVFKLKNKINIAKDDPNYDIFQKALQVTACCMNPTYFNCDSTLNKKLNPAKIGIMGCRTLLGENLHGTEGAVNRGNIASVTINLPQIAIESVNNNQSFYECLEKVFMISKELLLHRLYTLSNKDSAVQYIKKHNLYLNSSSEKALDILKNGTLSIGFIGLWETVMILKNSSEIAFDTFSKEGNLIIRYMAELINKIKRETQLNFSLLATSAEGVSGKFASNDLKTYLQANEIAEKGYYTNSFHIPVDLEISCFEKIRYEGGFHKYCSGGSITYVELSEHPQENTEALEDIILYATMNDCNYIGINFPLDYCICCGSRGVFNECCPLCFGKIVSLRRVSGYLSVKTKFVEGKYLELLNRASHIG